MKKSSFTLAEVLITLTIIGVIAALTIPNLIAHYEKQQTVVALKKVYSNMQQVVRLSVKDNGPISEWDTTLSEAEYAKKYFAPYLKLADNINIEKIKYKKINPQRGYVEMKPVLILSDGTYLNFYGSNMTGIIVDINGKKGPNKNGRDLFSFVFKNDTLITYTQYDTPMRRPYINGAGTSGQCNINATGGFLIGEGDYCSSLIEQDGWQIKDDYPW